MSSNGSTANSTTGILSSDSNGKLDYGSTSYSQVMVDVKNAFGRGDAEQSRLLHQLKTEMGSHTHAQENHMMGGEHIKSAVYGGLDGIITTFATVTSVAGSGLPHSVILIHRPGPPSWPTDSAWDSETCSAARPRPTSPTMSGPESSGSLKTTPRARSRRWSKLYEKKGISTDDALLVVHTLAKAGIITFLSFMLFGVIPLLSYLINLIPGISMSPDTTLYLSCFLTVVTLFLLGAVKGKFVGQKMWKSGGSMAINGTIAAACGWVIGYLLQLTGIQNIG
ncbi:hypothetical protein PRIC1_010287 [Phytophthora ramorum]